MWELTEGKLGEAPLPPTSVAPEAVRNATPDREEEDAEEDLTEMQSRLQALRS